ncbi:MAG: HD-GYP domain-containing protein [Deltaproteobacteria bacterium]
MANRALSGPREWDPGRAGSPDVGIEGLLEALRVHDPYTAGHGERVAVYTQELARALGAPADELQRVYLAGLLHDIGKLWVPRSLLQKPCDLEPPERRLMQTHARSGYELLRTHALEPMGRLVEQHHERLDGQGYPAGCVGEQIDHVAMLVAVADTYDAMTTDRVYRPALGRTLALSELRRVAGTQLDAHAVEAFIGRALARSEARLGRAPARPHDLEASPEELPVC